jgi:hypothetical protein
LKAPLIRQPAGEAQPTLEKVTGDNPRFLLKLLLEEVTQMEA